MSTPTIFSNSVIFNDSVSFAQAPDFPSAAISDDDVSGSANIAASKLICHAAATYQFAAPTVEPAASTYQVIHISGAAGTIVGVQGVITGTIPSSTANTVKLNLYRSTAGSTFASVLSTPLAFDNASVLLVPQTATISNTTMASGDVWAFTCTLTGTSTNARGFAAKLKFAEKYA